MASRAYFEVGRDACCFDTRVAFVSFLCTKKQLHALKQAEAAVHAANAVAHYGFHKQVIETMNVIL